ncbi:hypothetical protein [Saccharolobus caldissimus]|uniref:Uncharacterized protein n=1 Tax=Saccharolobus caldissimus TaxID=1702097 RepID=A0AAQ4CWT0_9CREN|nr:hypothetical protein [Saccharolobus caldissimus]BDC00262.1 hypothetical protein SACC_32780 [Saccharolobus caldissimus]
MKAVQLTNKILLIIMLGIVNVVAYAQPPSISVQPTPFQGASNLQTLLSYAMYAAWLVVFGMIIVAAVEAARGNHMGDTFKRALIGVIIAAFLLTFGWAIISGVF